MEPRRVGGDHQLLQPPPAVREHCRSFALTHSLTHIKQASRLISQHHVPCPSHLLQARQQGRLLHCGWREKPELARVPIHRPAQGARSHCAEWRHGGQWRSCEEDRR